ncbi:protealysin inhibitor emfourin [Microbacterium panaciterrae]|uniref:Uncharacterized protein n=1 Tax=Microbacterium panaciterrae TaxID=985759 RepID=A0ABP8PP97_9MICO
MDAPHADRPVGAPAGRPRGAPVDPESAEAVAGDAEAEGVLILVARSGGIAGMTRRWSVEPADGEAQHWMALVDRCPWDDEPAAGTGADRFVWRIEAHVRRVRHEQIIPEEHLQGPWRDLVDAVRAAGADTGADR